MGLSVPASRSSSGTGASSAARVNATMHPATRRPAQGQGGRPSGKTRGTARTSSSQPSPRRAEPTTASSAYVDASPPPSSPAMPTESTPSPIPHAAAPASMSRPTRWPGRASSMTRATMA